MFNKALQKEPRGLKADEGTFLGGFCNHLETLCFPWRLVIGPRSNTLESVSTAHQGESSEAGLGNNTFWGQWWG